MFSPRANSFYVVLAWVSGTAVTIAVTACFDVTEDNSHDYDPNALSAALVFRKDNLTTVAFDTLVGDESPRPQNGWRVEGEIEYERYEFRCPKTTYGPDNGVWTTTKTSPPSPVGKLN